MHDYECSENAHVFVPYETGYSCGSSNSGSALSFESFPLSRGSLLQHQWQSRRPTLAASLVAGVSARDAAWVTRAWGYGAKATIIHGQGRSRSHDIKRWARWRDDTPPLGPHSRRAFSGECSCPIAFSLTSAESTIIGQIRLVDYEDHI